MLIDNFFKIAQNHFNDALPFVLYRKPNASVVKGLFQKDDAVYVSENLTESGFVFAPFDANNKTILMPLEESELFESDVLSQQKQNDKVNFIEVSNTTRDYHINIVSKAIKAIENQVFKKVVISRKEDVNLLELSYEQAEYNPIEFFKRLLSQYKTAFVYCWYHPKIGLWLGATPETLLSVTGNRFTTMALAGTQEFKGEENTTWETKETEEQQFVTDFIVDGLKPSVKNLYIGNLETVKAGNLLHLRTKISGILNSNLKAIVDVLHPTPAVCGLPKAAAKQFILKNENYNRKFYTGFLGELNIVEKITRNTNRRNVENSAYASVKKVSHLFVNLRCMALTDVKASIYVGGGITKDSIPENEWQETVNKTQTMKKVLF